jgi:murein DD-endopeptidase MepM/ murein hydrolase activator NlpD
LTVGRRKQKLLEISYQFFLQSYTQLTNLMRDNLFKKRLIVFGAKLALSIINAVTAFYKLALTKRTVLFVTNQKIRSVTFGPISQASILLFVAWVCHLFIQSLQYDKIVSEKSNEIARISSSSSYFKEELESANEKLRKVNEYLVILTGSSHNVKATQKDNDNIKNFKEEDLSNKDKQTLNEVREVKQQFAEIESIATERIKKLENAISITGLNVKRKKQKDLPSAKEVSLNDKKDLHRGQGGPLHEDPAIDKALESANLSNDYIIESRLEKAQFINEIDHLMTLEKLANAIPLARPMKNYYVSSGFGQRTDPITGRKAVHRGLDFVGVNHEKIISPSAGRVVLAGKFSNYGNAVVIDHGYGITTRYGHLYSVKVKPGQVVKKGDVIALQGNTGRSTGQHLHYEVRYRNIPLNPKKFLEAGDFLDSTTFDPARDSKTFNYVNS